MIPYYRFLSMNLLRGLTGLESISVETDAAGSAVSTSKGYGRDYIFIEPLSKILLFDNLYAAPMDIIRAYAIKSRGFSPGPMEFRRIKFYLERYEYFMGWTT